MKYRNVKQLISEGFDFSKAVNKIVPEEKRKRLDKFVMENFSDDSFKVYKAYEIFDRFRDLEDLKALFFTDEFLAYCKQILSPCQNNRDYIAAILKKLATEIINLTNLERSKLIDYIDCSIDMSYPDLYFKIQYSEELYKDLCSSIKETDELGLQLLVFLLMNIYYYVEPYFTLYGEADDSDEDESAYSLTDFSKIKIHPEIDYQRIMRYKQTYSYFSFCEGKWDMIIDGLFGKGTIEQTISLYK